MVFSPGTRLGPYEIAAWIGEGGMGEVYRATDTTLKRQVAIKVLPASVAHDAERLARFQREAEVLAALNHPNIAQIYGLERLRPHGAEELGHDTIAIVMELVEGPTLADRIAQGALPVDEALPIARQIAEALEAAHEQGIIHRDLKPSNIKVRVDGTVKVLDFGLAKAMEPAPAPGSSAERARDARSSQSPTITTPAHLRQGSGGQAMTRAGMILGTAAYMSPEQARGKPVDRRADIWAFGCVLYEMLTGQRAFAGEDMSVTLADVIRAEPRWDRLPDGLSPSLETYIRRCLRKDAKERVRDIGDVRLALDGAFETATPASEPTPAWRSRTAALVAIGGALAGALAAAVLLWSPSGAPPTSGSTRTTVMLPEALPIVGCGFPTRPFALSPDGTQLVYTGASRDATPDSPAERLLRLRTLATLDVRDMPGTADACQPFFSANGQWVGFFTGAGELKKVSLAGGSPVTLASNVNGSQWATGVWTEDGTIIYATNSGGLRQVSAEGGAVTDLTRPAEGERVHYSPTPAGRAVLFAVGAPGTWRIDAVMRDSGTRRVVVENARHPQALDSGHLLFQRDEAILVAPFDLTLLTTTGPAVPILDAVQQDSSSLAFATLAVSRSGMLAYLPVAQTGGTLGLVGRDGAFEPLGPPAGDIRVPRASPDGQTIAFLETRGAGRGVYLYDRARGSTVRLGRDGSDLGAAWLPDGRALAVASQGDATKTAGIYLRGRNGSEQLLVSTPAGVSALRNAEWSPDGTRLAYTAQSGNAHDIWILTAGDASTTDPFVATPAVSELSPAFSPDGRWLAYGSDESGPGEVYVQRFPKGERVLVSTDGGRNPVWSRDGREIFFAGPHEEGVWMLAVGVETSDDTFVAGRPEPLFLMAASGAGVTTVLWAGVNDGRGYDVLPDGRFVMIRNPVTPPREIVLVQHWFEELERLAPTR